MPVAEPERISSELVRALKANGKAVYVAVHVNHARELAPAARQACARLAGTGDFAVVVEFLHSEAADAAAPLSPEAASPNVTSVHSFVIHSKGARVYRSLPAPFSSA